MAANTFLDKIAKVLIDTYSEKLSNTIVVLPNKRAKIFLVEALKIQVDTNILSPEIISIEEFIQEVASVRSVDPIELLFEFYEVYLSITEKSGQKSFEVFANWAKTLSMEVAADGVTVNNVLPGATSTARLQGIISNKAVKNNEPIDKISQEMMNEIPAGRFAEAEEIAAAVAFLASPAAAYINGINVPVDGGRTSCL